MLDRFLNARLKSILMSLHYSIIYFYVYFGVLLFRHFINIFTRFEYTYLMVDSTAFSCAVTGSE